MLPHQREKPSLQLHVGGLDDVVPAFDLFAHVGGGGGRRAADRFGGELSEALQDFGGATMANQAADSNPGSVCAIVGTSGSAAMRRGVATARSLSWPPRTSGNDTPRLSNMMSTLPPTRSVSAGAEPRYGTCWNFTAAISWNSSEVRCEVVPLPWVAEVTLPGFALAWAISSATLAAGSVGLA